MGAWNKYKNKGKWEQNIAGEMGEMGKEINSANEHQNRLPLTAADSNWWNTGSSKTMMMMMGGLKFIFSMESLILPNLCDDEMCCRV